MTGIVGSWTRRLPPHQGELLTSCLIRNAHAHGLSPYRFFNLIWPGAHIWSRDFDRDPELLDKTPKASPRQTWIEKIAEQLHIKAVDVEKTTLAPWRLILSEHQKHTGLSRLVLSAGIYHRSRTRHALQYCPECLRNSDPIFRKEWRLGFVVTCSIHGTPLRDSCPDCDAPVIPHRSPSVPPINCHLCGLLLTTATSRQDSIPNEVVKLQQTLLTTLEVAEEKGASNDVFNLVRALLAVSSPRKTRNQLAAALGTSLNGETAATGTFENLRLPERINRLSVVSLWMQDWPASFRHGAQKAKLTQNSFRRASSPPCLSVETNLLPAGRNVDRSWHPVIETPELKKLRRKDKAAYSSLRARKLVEFCTSRRAS